MPKKKESIRKRIKRKTQALRREIVSKDLLARGTIHTRRRVCGKKSCRCATDPDRWHGPYHEWSRIKDGRLAHTNLSPEQAELMGAAIANFRQVEQLLEQWMGETVEAVLTLPKRNVKKDN